MPGAGVLVIGGSFWRSESVGGFERGSEAETPMGCVEIASDIATVPGSRAARMLASPIQGLREAVVSNLWNLEVIEDDGRERRC